jgi:hypothetical protein
MLQLFYDPNNYFSLLPGQVFLAQIPPMKQSETKYVFGRINRLFHPRIPVFSSLYHELGFGMKRSQNTQ